jgi:branched-chain amino acid transport system ATP-binding protein
MTPLLVVNGLCAGYDTTQVLHDVTFTLTTGTITTLLGANGAGKTTTLRALCGLVPTRGSIAFAGQSLNALPTEDIVRLGIAHVPANRGTFLALTTKENLQLGAHTRRNRREIAEDFERIYTYFPILQQRHDQTAGTLSGGEQQMLALARALLLRPRLLLLDEPSAGLAPIIVNELFNILRSINTQEKVTILLVEQNITLGLELADHALFLETGRIILDGPTQAIRQHPAVRRAYLENNFP